MTKGGFDTEKEATTAGGYARAIVKISTKLGKVRPQALAPIQIEEMYFDLVTERLSPKSVRKQPRPRRDGQGQSSSGLHPRPFREQLQLAGQSRNARPFSCNAH